MSRFDDDLDRDIGVIAERVTPSPDAWKAIQQRIADREPEQETEIIMLTENTLTRRRWPLVAAAAAIAALAIGAIALVNRDDTTEQPADVPEPTPTVAPGPNPAPVPDSGADRGALPREGSAVEPGRYSADMLGVPVAFDVPGVTSGPWSVDLKNQAAFTIRTERGFVGMTRIGSFYDTAQAQNREMSGLGSIPPNGIDAWIDANVIVVDDADDVTVDGRDAQFRLVRTPAGSGAELCPADAQPCILMGSGSADLLEFNRAPAAALGGATPNAFWLIDMDDFEPLGIWVLAFDGDTDSWLDEIAPLIDSIELGEPAPAVEGGTARISTFAGAADADVAAGGEAVASGTVSFTDFRETPNDAGSLDVRYFGAFSGDMRGSVSADGFRLPDGTGASRSGATIDFRGEIEGLGVGGLTIEEANYDDDLSISVSVIVGGTDDLAGASGWGFWGPDPQDERYELHLSVPAEAPAPVETETVRLESAFELALTSEPEGTPGERQLVGSTTFAGEFTGEAPTFEEDPREADGITQAYSRREVTGSAEGVGAGTLTIEGPWRHDADGNYVGMARILSGTDDFEGASGFVRFDSDDAGRTGTATIQLVLPTG
ncbi:hypothetical protein [Ilumatobacter sp.]|uniref:hypothetical protein n=1 Tax=Ilumatobacter sp. TaxID=1967498 RepID=UPI003AF4DE10